MIHWKLSYPVDICTSPRSSDQLSRDQGYCNDSEECGCSLSTAVLGIEIKVTFKPAVQVIMEHTTENKSDNTEIEGLIALL